MQPNKPAPRALDHLSPVPFGRWVLIKSTWFLPKPDNDRQQRTDYYWGAPMSDGAIHVMRRIEEPHLQTEIAQQKKEADKLAGIVAEGPGKAEADAAREIASASRKPPEALFKPGSPNVRVA